MLHKMVKLSSRRAGNAQSCDHSCENHGKYGQGLSGDNEANMYLGNITRKSAKPSLSLSWLSSGANKSPKLPRMGKFSTQANTIYFPYDASNSEKHYLLCDPRSRRDWENSKNPSLVYDAQGLFWSIIVLALELKQFRNGSKWRSFLRSYCNFHEKYTGCLDHANLT